MKFARLCGADAIHMGSVGGKLPHAIIGDDSELRSRVSWLRARIKGIHKTMPIISGGMHPGSVAWNIERLGSNIIIQAGSGVLGHPGGPQAGGRAMRAAVDAALIEKPMHKALREVPELAAAVEKWGYLDSEGIHTLAELRGDNAALSGNIIVNTQGGSVVFGNVSTQGNFIGRDQTPAAESD